MKYVETKWPPACTNKYMEQLHQTGMPDFDALRNEALFAGALDPMSLRFQVVEYDKTSGKFLSVPCENLGFREAIETTAGLIQKRQDSHFCLEPVGFIQ
jgi:hypothetical protein